MIGNDYSNCTVGLLNKTLKLQEILKLKLHK